MNLGLLRKKLACSGPNCDGIQLKYLYTTGYAVAHLVEAPRYMLEGRGFDYRCCNWNFSLT
jgi:hypothetical protein